MQILELEVLLKMEGLQKFAHLHRDPLQSDAVLH